MIDDSRAFCPQKTLTKDQHEISASKTKMLNSLKPSRSTKNQALWMVRSLGPADNRTADDIRQEISIWERECEDQLPGRLLNAVVKFNKSNVSVTIHNNSEHPAGDVIVEPLIHTELPHLAMRTSEPSLRITSGSSRWASSTTTNGHFCKEREPVQLSRNSQ